MCVLRIVSIERSGSGDGGAEEVRQEVPVRDSNFYDSGIGLTSIRLLSAPRNAGVAHGGSPAYDRNPSTPGW